MFSKHVMVSYKQPIHFFSPLLLLRHPGQHISLCSSIRQLSQYPTRDFSAAQGNADSNSKNISRHLHNSRAAHAPAQHVAEVLDGRRVSAQWLEELAREVQHVSNKIKRPPGLSVILVGNRPDSMLYVTRKQEACQKVCTHAWLHGGAGAP